MVTINVAGGSPVTIGNFGNGFPSVTTAGDLVVPDPGIPLKNYHPAALSPAKVWGEQPAVRKVVGYAARQVGAVSLHLMLKDAENARKRDSDSKAERVWRRPAGTIGGQTMSSILQSYVVDRMLSDVSCLLYVNDTLVRIPPQRLQISADFLGRVTKIEVIPDEGEPLDITAAPKAFGFGWSANGAGGVPATGTLANMLEEARRAVQWRSAQWDHAVKQPAVLTRPVESKWNDKERIRFNEEWKKWKRGDADGTPILEGGMDYKELRGPSPRDAQDVESRQLTDAEVSSFFHIPPELTGAREASFANITALRRMLYGPVLGPVLKQFEQEFTNGLLPSMDSRAGAYFAFDVQGAMSGSFDEQVATYSKATGGPFMTRAEARADLDLPYLEGTEELVVPKNVSEGGQASPEDSGEQNVSDDPGATPFTAPAPSDENPTG